MMLMLGSEGLLGDGSTKAPLELPGAPGLRRKVNGVPMENQIRPPAICGMTAEVVDPGAPRAMAQLTARGAPVEEGEVGKYGVLPSD